MDSITSMHIGNPLRTGQMLACSALLSHLFPASKREGRLSSHLPIALRQVFCSRMLGKRLLLEDPAAAGHREIKNKSQENHLNKRTFIMEKSRGFFLIRP